MRRLFLLTIAFVVTAAPAGAQTLVPGATGDQRELFVPVYFAGTARGDLTAESFASRADQYQRTVRHWSHDRLRIVVQWHDWLEIRAVPPCDYSAIVQAATQALAGAGWTQASLSPFRKITFLTPTGCPSMFNGQAGIGGRVAVLYGSMAGWEHESLHRYGLAHSGVRQIEADGRPYITDMGNQFDIMGAGRDLSGPSRLRLGWLTPAQVSDVSEPREFVVNRLEAPDANLKLLRTPLGPNENWRVTPNGNRSDAGSMAWLFIELREEIVVFHASLPSNDRWWYVGSLRVGATSFGGVSVEVLELNANTARVRLVPLSSPREPGAVR